MKKFLISSSILLSMFISLPTLSLTSEQSNELNSGKPVILENIDKKTGKATTEMLMILNRPPQKVWDVLNDIEHYTEFMPIKKAEIKVKRKNTYIIFLDLEAPLMMDVYYTQKRVLDKKNWKISYKRLSGKLKSVEGSWKLEPHGDGKQTMVTYMNNVDIGIPVPDFVIRFFSKGSLLKVADYVKKRVESDGKWKRN